MRAKMAIVTIVLAAAVSTAAIQIVSDRLGPVNAEAADLPHRR